MLFSALALKNVDYEYKTVDLLSEEAKVRENQAVL